jgi:hypothetical protein
MQSDWSASEKKIARRVFDAALHRELAEVMGTFKSMAKNATEPNDMWSTEEFLTKSRNSIDRKYDYRYSQLEFVFGRLLREGRISEDDLSGIAEDKIQNIVRIGTL